MKHNPILEHALNDTHGGVIATLLDNAGWFTVAVQYETWIATVELPYQSPRTGKTRRSYISRFYNTLW